MEDGKIVASSNNRYCCCGLILILLLLLLLLLLSNVVILDLLFLFLIEGAAVEDNGVVDNRRIPVTTNLRVFVGDAILLFRLFLLCV